MGVKIAKVSVAIIFIGIISVLLASGCGRLWGGLSRYNPPSSGPGNGSSTNYVTGLFAGALGNTTASIGTCPPAGPTNAWCTGGTFGSATTDGAFNQPSGVAIDSVNGFMYVTDKNNNRVVKINLSTGVFVGAIGNTSATTGTCPAAGATPGWCTGGTFTSGSSDGMFNAPNGVAVDPIGGILYVADNNSRVAKINAASGAFIGAIGYSTATTGTCPTGTVAPGWCTGGTFTSFTQDGSYAGPTGLAIDTTNNFLYVSDNGDSKVSKVTLSTGAFVGAIGSTSFTSGTCPGGNLAAPGWCTGGLPTWGTGDGMFHNATGVAIDPTNDSLYVADATNGRIEKFYLSTGAFIGAIGRATASTGTCPAGSNVPGWCTGGTFFASAGDGKWGTPWGLAIDVINKFLYIADYAGGSVSKVNATTGAFVGNIGYLSSSTGTCPASGTATTWCTGGSFTSPGDGAFFHPLLIALDPNGLTLYVSDSWDNRIEKFK